MKRRQGKMGAIFSYPLSDPPSVYTWRRPSEALFLISAVWIMASEGECNHILQVGGILLSYSSGG